MRKLCIWGLVALLLLSVGTAQASPEPLSMTEMLNWRDVIFEGLDQQQTAEAISDDVYLLETAYGSMELTQSALKGQSSDILLHIELTDAAMADPRGLRVGDAAQTVLAAYAGSELALEDGVFQLYAQDGETLMWGWGMATGGIITRLQYTVAQPDPDMTGYYQELGLIYTLEQGQVSTIRAYGFSELIQAEEATANFKSAQLQSGYAGEAIPFELSDLVFSGLNLLSATPGDIKDIFGEPMADTYLESEGLRVLSYSDMLFELSIGAENDIAFNALLITARTLPGPRGIQVGDSLDSVLARFSALGNEDLLYGTLEDGAFGLITREEDGSVIVRYFIPAEAGVLDRGMMLHLFFQNEQLVEYLIYAQEP